MFAKLKKKIAEEAATAPRSGRLPRSTSKESITSMGADSGDDFASDGSSSRDDLSSQILRRNDQIRKLEAKLSDYAEQLRQMQKTKDKLEVALEKHQDSSMRKLQDQNESYQSGRAKMAEGMALALEKKDQEWTEKMAALEQEKAALSVRLEEMTEQSLSLFQKRDDHDELEGFQQQELAKVKHMLLRREEELGQRERELQQKEAELQVARQALDQAQAKLHQLGQEQQETSRLNTDLQAEREEAETKISELEQRGHDLQLVVQQVSEDFQKAQSSVMTLEKCLDSLQTEHDELKLQHEQHRNKALVMEEERERLLCDLQEKASSLERRLQGNYSLDEHLQDLLKEKSSLEQRLEESREELLEERTNHSNTVSSLDAQVSRLNGSVAELQTLLQHKDESYTAYRERTETQQVEWEVERGRLQQCEEAQRQRGLEETARLEEQLTALHTERDALHTTHLSSIRELEEEKVVLLQIREDTESALNTQTQELEQARLELSSRQTVSVEIAKALEDTRRQKEELQLLVGEMTVTLQGAEQEATRLSEQLGEKEEELRSLREELQAALSEVELLRAEAEEREQDKNTQLASLQQEVLTQETRVCDLQGEVDTLTGQLQGSEASDGEQNGAVTVGDLDHLQATNKHLEQQLSDKNKMIKQLQQRLAELKRTLQKELKLKPDPESEGKEKLQEGRADRQERPSDKPSTEVPAPAAPLTPASGLGSASTTSRTTVINSSDLTDTREINFEYLKHVVLKFMSSREAEAFQLIRAVSVLLHFTHEEEDMLKQMLEYKMSWFGSKPSPKGIIRPSVSGAPTPWS